MKNKNKSIETLSFTGILSAIAFSLMFLEFPIPFLIPPFIKFDFSYVPALIGAFMFGPLSGIFIELIKNLLHTLVSNSFGVGELSNFILGATFTGIAGFLYKKDRTIKKAFRGSFIGAISMGIISIFSNYFIVYPFYYNFIPKKQILLLYQNILPSTNSIFMAIILFNLPFTIVKGIINMIFAFIIYRKISPLLNKEMH